MTPEEKSSDKRKETKEVKMYSTQYDEKYIKKCRRRAKFEKVKYVLFWAVPLALLIIIAGALIYFFSVKTAWQKFIWVLANDVSYAEGENSMRATHGDDDVCLSYNNCVNLYNTIVDADADGAVFSMGLGGREKIHIDFGNGHTMDIINIDEDRCFIKYCGEKKYSFKIGVQGAFTKFLMITSPKGANYGNIPWSQRELPE